MRTPRGGQLERRLRRQLHLAAAGEAGAVEEERQPMPRFVPLPALALAREAGALDRLAQHRRARSCRRRSTWPVAVVSPGLSAFIARSVTGSMPSVSAMRSMCTSTRELRLRRAEAAERAVGRRVGPHRAAADAHVGTAIRSGRVNARRATARPGSACSTRRRPARRRCPWPTRRPSRVRPVRCRTIGGMPLRRRDHVLDAVVDHLHRPAGLAREQRRVAGDVRRVFLLAAKPAAGFGLHDAHARRPAARAAPSAPGARSTGHCIDP